MRFEEGLNKRDASGGETNNEADPGIDNEVEDEEPEITVELESGNETVLADKDVESEDEDDKGTEVVRPW